MCVCVLLMSQGSVLQVMDIFEKAEVKYPYGAVGPAKKAAPAAKAPPKEKSPPKAAPPKKEATKKPGAKKPAAKKGIVYTFLDLRLTIIKSNGSLQKQLFNQYCTILHFFQQMKSSM